jgi:uncharacterized oxidoreductase
MQISNNKILITGGATGIGLGLTERFIAEGNIVIICGRRQAVLEAVAERHPTVITKACDLSDEQERTALYEWIKADHPDTNVLVNNAGIQNLMNFSEDGFYERAKAEIATNLVTPIHLMSLFTKLPSVSTIINITSGLAFVPSAAVPVYCATKAFMRSFTLSLRYQMKPKNIEVIEIIPPGLNTDLGAPGIHDNFPPVSDFIESVFEQLHEGRTELTFGTSEDWAKADNERVLPLFNKMNP